MKDLHQYFGSTNLAVKEVDETNDSFISHIPYNRTFTEHSTKEYLNNAIREMIIRYSKNTKNNRLSAQFSDEGYPGASDIIISSVRHAVNIITALLSRIDISALYKFENMVKSEKEIKMDLIDHLSILNAEFDNFENEKLSIIVEYNKIFPNGMDAFIKPVFVRINVPITDRYDGIRNRKEIIAGDAVYFINVGFRYIDFDNVADMCKLNMSKVETVISKTFDGVVNMLYNALDSNSKSNCLSCINNKIDNFNCICKTNIDIGKALNWLEKYDFIYNSDTKAAYEFKIRSSDVGIFNRFDSVSKELIEYSLAIDDYLALPESEEESNV